MIPTVTPAMTSFHSVVLHGYACSHRQHGRMADTQSWQDVGPCGRPRASSPPSPPSLPRKYRRTSRPRAFARCQIFVAAAASSGRGRGTA
jgi:hypothetical protein